MKKWAFDPKKGWWSKKVDDGPLYHQEWSKPTRVSLKYVVKWVKTVHNGLKSRQKKPQSGKKLFRNGYILSKLVQK